MDLDQAQEARVAVVTGAAHGIGAAIAEALAGVGMRVAILDIDGPATNARAAHLGSHIAGWATDVTDEESVRRSLGLVIERFGRIDVLVNNAALTAIRHPKVTAAPILELSVARWRRVLDVNLTGAFICAQQAARLMRDGGGGLVVNIASIQGVCPTQGTVDYATSKAGLIMLTRCLAGELAPYRIRVNAVAPGPVATEPTVEDLPRPDTLSGRWVEPDDVAQAVVFLASPEARFVNGHVLMVDDGASVRFREAPARAGADA